MHLINSHLFQQTPSGDDVLFDALIDKATTLGYTLPSANTLSALNTLIKDMRRIGMIQRLDLFHVYASDLGEETDFRLMNIVNPEMIGEVNSAIIWSNQGSKGVASSNETNNAKKGYIDTHFNPSSGGYNYQLNNASVGCVVYDYDEDLGIPLIGNALTSGSSVNTTLSASPTGNTHRINVAAGATTSPNVPTNNRGLILLSRSNNANSNIINTHNTTTLTSDSSIVHNSNIHIHVIGGRALSQTITWGGQGISCAFAGASIPYEMAQNFRQVYNKYLRTIGLQQVA